MSVSLLIAVNVLADVALLGGLAYVMSHARHLTPHVGSVQPAVLSPAEQPLAWQLEQSPAHRARPNLARPRASTGRRAGADGTAAYKSAG
jgi:hypothetical protein